jgi:hypothetical protein
VSKSRQRRIAALLEKEGSRICAQLVRDSRPLMTEHVADVIEGAEMRVAARRMLNTPVPTAVSARLVSALFRGSPNPKITQTTSMNTSEIVEGVIEDD